MEIFGHNYRISTKMLKLQVWQVFALGSRIIGTTKTTCVDIKARFSVVLKVSKVVKQSRIFVRSIRDLPNFLTIPIISRFMILINL